MLTPVEQLSFIVMAFVSGILTATGFYGVFNIVHHGRSAPPLRNLPVRLAKALIDIGLQRTMFRTRPILSAFHTLIFFGFSLYFVINVIDLLEGFIPGFELLYGGESLTNAPTALINLFNLAADLLSVLTLVGMVAFLVRRFLGRDKRLNFNDNVLLHPKVKKGWLQIDSAIVGLFIIAHVGARFLGQTLRLAENGRSDPFMPFASLAAGGFAGLSENAFNSAIHLTWWLAIGLLALFMPYFVRSKHFHLLIAPFNLALARQSPPGRLDPVATENGSNGSQPGAAILQDLAWPRLLDGYACIMCNRCHELCPAHQQGLSLSPAALEINKRYLFNQEFMTLARGGRSTGSLTGHLLDVDAAWSCSACYACVHVCPVGNEPMADIIDVRRSLVMTGELAPELQDTLANLGRYGNSFGQSPRRRARWSRAVRPKIKDARKESVDYLWFVGDYASYSATLAEITRLTADLFTHLGLDFGILYESEQNAGNDVRRVGEEGLFEMLVEKNVQALEKCSYKAIVTTDPHSYNTLKNEYPPGINGQRPILHYTELLDRLLADGRLIFNHQLGYNVTYQDPCYLGRYNGIYDPPRRLIQATGCRLIEMPRSRDKALCCGAGGGRIWLPEGPVQERAGEMRIREAAALSGVTHLIVTCPKDVTMYQDAVKTTGHEGQLVVKELVELLHEAL